MNDPTCNDCTHYNGAVKGLCRRRRFTKGKHDLAICPDFRRKNMPNIKITAEVNGKQVPLENISTETFEAIKALEKPKEIPVARLAVCRGGRRRLIFKVTESVVEHKGSYIAIDLMRGSVEGHWPGDDGDCGKEYGYDYENVKPL